jgi:hypothetical protein
VSKRGSVETTTNLPVAGFFLALQINFHFWIDQYLDLNGVYAVHSEYIGDPFTPVDPIRFNHSGLSEKHSSALLYSVELPTGASTLQNHVW